MLVCPLRRLEACKKSVILSLSLSSCTIMEPLNGDECAESIGQATQPLHPGGKFYPSQEEQESQAADRSPPAMGFGKEMIK